MKFKKLLSSTLLAATVLTAVAGGAGAEEIKTDKAEVTQLAAGYAVKSTYAKQINNMIELGAVDVKKGATINPKSTLTRAQVAKAIGVSEPMVFSENKDFKAQFVEIGYVGASYDWNKTATRGDVFQLLGKMMVDILNDEEPSIGDIVHITDISKLNIEEKQALNTLFEFELVTGNGGKVMLDNNITLEHLCKILDTYNKLGQ